jgi:hypothetical protein
MVRDRDPVVCRLEGFQDDMTPNLMHSRVLPSAAQRISEIRSGDVAR